MDIKFPTSVGVAVGAALSLNPIGASTQEARCEPPQYICAPLAPELPDAPHDHTPVHPVTVGSATITGTDSLGRVPPFINTSMENMRATRYQPDPLIVQATPLVMLVTAVSDHSWD